MAIPSFRVLLVCPFVYMLLKKTVVDRGLGNPGNQSSLWLLGYQCKSGWLNNPPETDNH